MPRSVVSIDSYFSPSEYSDDEEYRIAQQEWEESLDQLAQVVSVVLLPFLGKWLGRRWSYWGQSIVHTTLSSLSVSLSPPLCRLIASFASHFTFIAYTRYIRLGLGRSFFLGERPTTP
ncbi:hypothetical protein B0F90DRAFT_88005 [Multifurca ochricompacta]|uniref:Uncharacterized protein n=1 Tax=Multifurca ochricompacta TaxID=376703 RepID=A0AAD4MD93_9AGAM|nr:hypothetical protein B0F90DRAFT_88005 [Multifurca ochricompacta]